MQRGLREIVIRFGVLQTRFKVIERRLMIVKPHIPMGDPDMQLGQVIVTKAVITVIEYQLDQGDRFFDRSEWPREDRLRE